jgi:hypothetical protein
MPASTKVGLNARPYANPRSIEAFGHGRDEDANG